MAKRKRRAFGQVKPLGRYFEASYPTPVGYGDKFDGLKERQYASFGSEEEADAWLYQEKRIIELGAWSPVAMRKAAAKRDKEQSITFAEYARNWVETRRKPDGSPRASGTIKHDRGLLKNHLLKVFGNTPMREVSVRQVNAWIDNTAETMKDAPNARYNAYVLLNSIFASAATDPLDSEGRTLIDRSPVVRSIPRPPKAHKTVPVSDEQIWALHDLTCNRYKRPDIAMAALIGLYQGLRIGEVLSLRRCDVDRDAHKLSVSASLKDENELTDKPRKLGRGDTKTAESVRVNPIAPELRESLYRYIDEFVAQDPETPLFTAPRVGGFLSESSFSEVYVAAREQIPGLSSCRFHDLRHNHLTRMGNAAGVAVASRDAGHKSVRTTAVYMDAVRDDMLTEGYERLAAKRLQAESKPAASAAVGSGDVASWAQTLAQLDPAVRAQVLKELPAETQAKVMVVMLRQGEVS